MKLPSQNQTKPAAHFATPLGSKLNLLLAGEYANRVATRGSIGKAAGPDFTALRALLKTQFSGINARLNLLAWQIGAIGGCARIDPGDRPSMASSGGARTVGESQDDMLTRLIDLREAGIAQLGSVVGWGRTRCEDRGTMDLLADLTAYHERDVWMLRAMRWDLRAATA